MNIVDAAKLTRKYRYLWCGVRKGFICFSDEDNFYALGFTVHKTEEEAQVACDILNAVAFLGAIQEPSAGMNSAALYTDSVDCSPGNLYRTIWQAMINALITELKAR